MTAATVAVVGATGTVGQAFVRLLDDYPWFRLTELVASERGSKETYAPEHPIVHRESIRPPPAAKRLGCGARNGCDRGTVARGSDPEVVVRRPREQHDSRGGRSVRPQCELALATGLAAGTIPIGI